MDQKIFSLINGLSHKNAILDVIGIFFAQYLAYLMVLAALFLILKERDWKRRVYHFSLASLSVILSRGIITEIIRFFYHNPRPYMALNFKPLLSGEISFSFPSGHMAAYFALALAVFYINKKAGQWFLGIVVLMGIARIFVGVHWPSDILGGIVVAVLSFYAVKYFLPRSENFLALGKKKAPLPTE